MRNILVTRYVTPLREGGSLPAIVEADDLGLYVLKFKGAGQGTKALIAELISAQLAQITGLPIPEVVFANLNAGLARTEADPEIRDLIKNSGGLNLAIDYLPGSVMFNPVVDTIDPYLASLIVWFDSYIMNVDRTFRNTNMLVWHKKLYLIDHGASLFFHHRWADYIEKISDPFPLIKDHVLLSFADSLEKADKRMKEIITSEAIENIVNLIPEEWLVEDVASGSSTELRNNYKYFLKNRLQSSEIFLKEAISARSTSI